jgi:hypothetical protein
VGLIECINTQITQARNLNISSKLINYNEIDRAKYVPLKFFTDLAMENPININELNEIKYFEIGCVEKYGHVNAKQLNIKEIYFDATDKGRIQQKILSGNIDNATTDCILIPKVRPHLQKIVLVSKEQDEFFSQDFLKIIPTSKRLDKLVLLYYLLSKEGARQLESLSSIGKGYPTIDELTFITNFLIPNSLLDIPESELQKIYKLHDKISNCMRFISPIDEISRRAFNSYLTSEVESSKSIFSLSSNEISKQKHIKIGFKSSISDFDLKTQAIQKTWNVFKLGNIVKCPILLGCNYTSEDVDEESNFSVIIPQTLKQYYIDKTNLVPISSSVYEKISNWFGLQKNDIIFCRSAEGTLGKVALIDSDINNMTFCYFTARIRIDENVIDPKYIFYYMMNQLTATFIETNKEGMGNLTNIYPKHLVHLPILIPKDKNMTKRIVDQIDKEAETSLSNINQVKTLLQEVEHIMRKIN